MDGQLLFTLMLAVVLSMAGAVGLGVRLRRAVRRLMQEPALATSAATSDAASVATSGTRMPAADVTEDSPPADSWGLRAPDLSGLAQSQGRAQARLVSWLIGVSVLMALTASALQLLVVYGDGLFSLRRWLLVGLVGLWPALPALGLLWRWSRLRVLGALLVWALACGVLLAAQSTDAQEASGLALYIGGQIGLPLLAVMAICLGQSTRTFAPWLFLPVLLFCATLSAALHVLALAVQAEAGWLVPLLKLFGAWGTIAVVALTPWLLAWWPARALARAVARAHARHWVSDLLVLFAAVWALQLTVQALSALSVGVGPALAMLLPLAWLPLGVAWLARARPVPEAAPVLLVLRVFQQDRHVRALFDQVVERWRGVGHTVLIAGTDLLVRTAGVGELMLYLQGRLDTLFVRTPAQVPWRLAAFDREPDLDTRFRVNACYCCDDTWRDALAALVARSDRVLMDLRRFHAGNEGCLHELRVLAGHPRPSRIVVVTDSDEGLALARTTVEQAAGFPGSTQRFSWIAADRLGGRRLRQTVLDALLVAAPAQAHQRHGPSG